MEEALSTRNKSPATFFPIKVEEYIRSAHVNDRKEEITINNFPDMKEKISKWMQKNSTYDTGLNMKRLGYQLKIRKKFLTPELTLKILLSIVGEEYSTRYIVHYEFLLDYLDVDTAYDLVNKFPKMSYYVPDKLKTVVNIVLDLHRLINVLDSKFSIATIGSIFDVPENHLMKTVEDTYLLWVEDIPLRIIRIYPSYMFTKKMYDATINEALKKSSDFGDISQYLEELSTEFGGRTNLSEKFMTQRQADMIFHKIS